MTLLTKSSLQILVVAIGFAIVVWSTLQQPVTVWRGAGLVIAFAAFVLWTAARIQLGSSFSIRARARELVTRGVYSKIRNPIYVSGALFFAGLVLATGRPRWLVVELIVIPMQVFRARREARVLEEKFGDAYREYRARTWF